MPQPKKVSAKKKKEVELPPASKAVLHSVGIEIEERTGRDWSARGFREMHAFLVNHAAFAAYLEGLQ